MRYAVVLIITLALQVKVRIDAFSPRAFAHVRERSALRANDTPEYIIEDDDSDDSEYIPEARTQKATPPVVRYEKEPSSRAQYAALTPGTVVHMQIGDISLARKAWKKRRRSGSPLLVPCSVLNVDRVSTLRWNLIYLTEKFGTPSPGGVRLSLEELSSRHRTHLKSALTPHAVALGYENSAQLVESLFSKKEREIHGVKLLSDDDNKLYLELPTSKFKAQRKASKAPIVQFTNDEQEDMLRHTGCVRTRREDAPKGENIYQLQPLSAALRVSREELDKGEVRAGDVRTALVFDFDLKGDAGEPLMTLSLNPVNTLSRDYKKSSDRKYETIQNPQHIFSDLTIGDEMHGKVVRLAKYGALVDCGVGRKLKGTSEMVRVLGYIRFKDTRGELHHAPDNDLETSSDGDDQEIEADKEEIDMLAQFDFSQYEKLDEDDESSEDITHLFEQKEDGSFIYRDPTTGNTENIGNLDSDESEPVETCSRLVDSRSEKKTRLEVGDLLKVFVKSVSKQSCQLKVTTDSSIQGKKAKELRSENSANKKLSRLEKQLGGLGCLEELNGRIMDGVVKASSKSGDWLYVEPLEYDLPVGIASISECSQEEFGQGDAVRIELIGVDEQRGQLALKVIEKATP